MNSTPSSVLIELPDEAATTTFAQTLSNIIYPYKSNNYNDSPNSFDGARLYLKGELGAGKTTFARAFLRSLGVEGRIKSPTYTLLESYNLSRLYLYHFDFYRFNSSSEWQEAGFQEQFFNKGIVLVEWPEKADDQLPEPDLEINLFYLGEGRQAELKAFTNKGKLWLTKLNNQNSQ